MKNVRTSLFIAAVFGLSVLCGPALAVWTQPLPITDVDTEYDENAPFLSFDGLPLYLTSIQNNLRIYYQDEQSKLEGCGILLTISQQMDKARIVLGA